MGWMVDAVRLLAKGGYVMIPLMICSVISIAIIIERYGKILAAQKDVSDVVQKAVDLLYKHDDRAALKLLDDRDSPVTRVLATGIRGRHLGERGVERAMEEQGMQEVSRLGHRLGNLDTIITIAPLLGLLGTVTGMISAFNVIATREGISTPTAITGGVAEALIATATGLFIAIFTLVFYNNLQERVKGIVSEIETCGTGLVNVLSEIGEGGSEITSLSA